MQAATVKMLTEKATFPPETAVAIAEAIDMTIAHADLVTVPILDSRIAKIEARIDARFAESEARIDARFAQREARIDARFAQSEARIDARFAQVDVRFAQVDARFGQIRSEIRADMQEIKAELVRWVLLAMLGSIAISSAASAIVDALRH